MTIGISGDACAATGLSAGCDVWYSVIGGLYPKTAKVITTAALKGNRQEALLLSDNLNPLWDLFRCHGGSLRVVSSAAEIQNLVKASSLPFPLSALEGVEREKLANLINHLGLS